MAGGTTAALMQRMHQKLALSVPLFALLFTACLTEPVESDPTAKAADSTGAAPVPPPDPLPPRIRRLAWHWTACGPSASPLPFMLTVKVELAQPDDSAIRIEGQATGCKPFVGNGVASPCEATSAAAIVRDLVVSASDLSGQGDKVSTPVIDCTDGETSFPPDDEGDAL